MNCILVIGSASDIDGRKMGNIIDCSNKYDLVVRVNKPYGSVEDVGTRTDLIIWYATGFKYYWEGFEKAHKEAWNNAKFVISTAKPITNLLQKYNPNGQIKFSTGFRSLVYLKAAYPNKHIDVIGFGSHGQDYNTDGKFYTKNGYMENEGRKVCAIMKNINDLGQDINNEYDFTYEHELELKMEGVQFL